jgi:WXG100 family type VII secretion target
MTDPTGVPIAVPPDLEASGATILGIATAIGDELAQLRNLLMPLHEYWTGGAQENWQPLQAQWDASANDLMAAPGTLGAIAHTATTNWGNYVDCEAANIRTWAH